jgi:hypothetical protein
MKKRKCLFGVLVMLVGCGSLSLLFLDQTHAKAYEFWGKAQVIHCDKSVMIGKSESLDLSVHGKVVSAKAQLQSEYAVHFGTEVTCNGFTLTTCPGTDCQLRQ